MIARLITLSFIGSLGLLSVFFSCTGCAENPVPEASSIVKLSDEQLLDSVQYYTFQYFWDGAETNSGMAPE
jgi:hypothetical protein